MRMRTLVISVLLLIQLGCSVDPVTSKRAPDNPAITVDLLTTFDGIRLYRIWVGGRAVFVAARDTGPIRTQWDEPSGKTTVPQQVNNVE